MQFNVMNPNWYWDLPTLPAGVVKVDKTLGYNDPNWSTASVAKVNAQQKTYASLLFDLYSPDILFLNERFAEWNSFTASLTANKGYAIVGTTPAGHETNCNPILYNSAEFTLIKSGVFDFSTSSIANTDNDTSGIRVMTWAILKSNTTQKSILVCNMHLQAGDDSVENYQIRKNQAIAVADQIATLLSQNSISGLILGGDMNSKRNATRNDNEAAVGSAYDGLLSELASRGVTHAYSSTNYGIDHLATMGCTVNKTGTYKGYLAGYISDHCPIYADFTLK